MFFLKFEPKNETHERHYTHLFMSISLTQRQIPVAEWDDVVSLLKKLKSIGVDTKEKVGNSSVYRLQDEGGELDLERAEMLLLKDFMKQPIWRPSALEDIKETIDFLEAAPKRPEVSTPRLEK